MLTVQILLAVAACVVTIVHAMGKCMLWPAVWLLAIIAFLRAVPLGR
jgi:hypothetical protein